MNRLFVEDSNKILRKIFNNEENLEIAKDFIEAVLKISIKEILIRPYLKDKIKYLPDEEKYGIAVYRVVDNFNNEFNVGIQIIDGLYAQEKMLIFGAAIHANQVEYEDHDDIVNTVTINILNSEVFKTNDFHKVLQFMGNSGHDDFVMINDELIFHILQLPNYIEKNPKTKEQEWLQYFKEGETSCIDKIKEDNEFIKKLDNLLIDYWKNEKI